MIKPGANWRPCPLSLALTARAPIVAVCAHDNVSGIDPTAHKISVDSVQDLATRWLSLRSARLAMDALRPFGEAGPWGAHLAASDFAAATGLLPGRDLSISDGAPSPPTSQVRRLARHRPAGTRPRRRENFISAVVRRLGMRLRSCCTPCFGFSGFLAFSLSGSPNSTITRFPRLRLSRFRAF